MKANQCFRYIFFVIISATILISGCKSMKKVRTSDIFTLKDIAYDVNKKSGYTVYIEENSIYCPYLVLTSDYNGNVLLLRKDVLEEDQVFNDYVGYYKDSLIDNYLNNDYRLSLNSELQDIIMDTEIVITSRDSMGIAGTDTEKITREIFLLSCTEVGLFDTSFHGKEGKKLKYFNDVKSRIAYHNTAPRSWWLRTGYTMNESTVWVVFTEGQMGAGGAYEECGVRPAFCLKSDTRIEKKNDVIDGQTVYVIAY